MRLIYHPEAEAELIEAAKYYERRVGALGVKFLNDPDRAVSMIMDTPQRWEVIEEDVRSYLMRRFPYAIYYRAFSDRVHILAFKHHSRHPDYWRHRVSV
jgi:plasmid stabilization system protein ParE